MVEGLVDRCREFIANFNLLMDLSDVFVIDLVAVSVGYWKTAVAQRYLLCLW